MPEPREVERRKTEFSPERIDERPSEAVNKALSSKRLDDDIGKQPEMPESTRARRPRSGRSGSDSNAGRRSRGH